MNIFKRSDPNLKRNARIQKDREQLWRKPLVGLEQRYVKPRDKWGVPDKYYGG